MFKIQISNPISLSVHTTESMNLEDAIELVFPLETEFLILIWNNIFIPLTYKYDISLMVLDFIKIINFLRDNNKSELEIFWPSSTFVSIWKIKRYEKVIRINSKWTAVNGKVENLLNSLNENEIQSSEFEEEIMKLIIFINSALIKSGMELNNIVGYENLVGCLNFENKRRYL
jgi:hypothetical protein